MLFDPVETNHRVANSFQMAGFFLRYEETLMPEARPALRRTAARLECLSQLHRQLMDIQDDGDMLDFSALLEQLCDHMETACGAFDRAPVARFERKIQPVMLTPQHCRTAGLVACEMIFNAIKHSPGGIGPADNGEDILPIEVGLRHVSGSRCSLWVENALPHVDGRDIESRYRTLVLPIIERLAASICVSPAVTRANQRMRVAIDVPSMV